MSETAIDPRVRIEASWQELMGAIEDIPMERLVETGAVGEWSVKDVLGHIAFWDGATIAPLERVARGEPAWPPSDGDGDDGGYQPINEREAALRADRSADEILRELHETHAKVLDALDAALTAEASFNPQEFAGNTWEHYADHTAGIRAYRERAGL